MKTSDHSPRTLTRYEAENPTDWTAATTERQIEHLSSLGLDPHPDESLGSAAQRINRVFSLRREFEHRALRGSSPNGLTS